MLIWLFSWNSSLHCRSQNKQWKQQENQNQLWTFLLQSSCEGYHCWDTKSSYFPVDDSTLCLTCAPWGQRSHQADQISDLSCLSAETSEKSLEWLCFTENGIDGTWPVLNLAYHDIQNRDTWETLCGVFPAVTSNPMLSFHLDVFHPLAFQLLCKRFL